MVDGRNELVVDCIVIVLYRIVMSYPVESYELIGSTNKDGMS